MIYLFISMNLFNIFKDCDFRYVSHVKTYQGMNPQSLSEAYLAVVAPLCSLEIWVLVRFGFEDVAASLPDVGLFCPVFIRTEDILQANRVPCQMSTRCNVENRTSHSSVCTAVNFTVPHFRIRSILNSCL